MDEGTSQSHEEWLRFKTKEQAKYEPHLIETTPELKVPSTAVDVNRFFLSLQQYQQQTSKSNEILKQNQLRWEQNNLLVMIKQTSSQFNANNINNAVLPSTLQPIRKQLIVNHRKWNDEYQSLHSSTAATPFDLKERSNKMQKLVDDFTIFSQHVAEIIVEEMHETDPQRRQVQPINIGGIHGGVKFRCGEVLFKFARDKHSLFGGNDELAQKAAANEIRGMNAIIQADLPHLHTTLTALFYIQGHCIIATAFAPLQDSQTLVYGSSDGSDTIHKKSGIVPLVQQLAQILNLKPHVVIERSTQKSFVMDLAVDVEGHVGTDGLYYMVDLARLFPPRFPRSHLSTDVWWRQFRPEFMLKCCDASCRISSDCFTTFGQVSANEHHQDVTRAEVRLHDRQFKLLVRDLFRLMAAQLSPEIQKHREELSTQMNEWGQILLDVSRMFHSHGVNISDMGAVYQSISSPSSLDNAASVKRLLIHIMVARTVKCLIRQWIRVALESLLTGSDVVLFVLGQFFSAAETGQLFWQELVIPATMVSDFRLID